MILNDISESIGGTPHLRIPAELTGLRNIDLFIKLEFLNPFGSLKDRVAWGMLKEQLPALKAEGRKLIENSSGNTAKAIAVLAQRAGVPFRLVSAIVKVREQKEILKLLGVELEEVSGSANCYDPSDPNDPQNVIEREVLKSNGKLLFTSQFTNPANPKAHYDTTAEEIITDLGEVHYLCAGLGTAGSSQGISQRLREVNPGIKLVGVAAASSDYIPGIRTRDQLLEAGIFSPELFDQIQSVGSQQAIDGMLLLIRQVGLLVGPSSGAQWSGFVEYLRKIDGVTTERKVAVMIACDRVEWYLSYIKERRPELFKERKKPLSIFNLSAEMIRSSPGVSPESLSSFIEKEQPLIVDTRSPIAFDMGSLQGAVNLPADLLEKLLDSERPFTGRERAVLFICPVGRESERFAAQLSRLGGRGYSLVGGLVAARGVNPDLLSRGEGIAAH